MKPIIQSITADAVLDSRGMPTVRVRAVCDGGSGVASVPSGASTGRFEAVEKRDGGEQYMGKGVDTAVACVNEQIAPLLVGMRADAQYDLDQKMLLADNTPNKATFGANAILAVSLACAKAAAAAQGVPLFRYIGGANACVLPVPMMNILNGGAHASNPLDFQEFMIMPVGADSFAEGLRKGVETYHALKSILKDKGLSTAVGDEGGFAPEIDDERTALSLLCDAIEQAGYRPGEDIMLAMDAAASEWVKGGEYRLPKAGRTLQSGELIELFDRLCREFPIASIEDPLGEDDFDGFRQITRHFAGKVQIVGDDLFVTNPARISQGILAGSANAVLIKPNQVGSLSETLEAVRLATRHDYRCILSHRSGDTEDTTIADLAVATSCGQIKTGAPCRSERVCKYNRLLQIERMLGESARYLGRAVLR